MNTERNLKAVIILLSLIVTASFAARYALLVGCNDGGSGVEQLQWAEADAGRFAGLLEALGGFERASIVTLLHPDSAALDKELRLAGSRQRSSKSPENDLFLLYYSGHADGHDLLLGTTRFHLKKVQGYLDSLSAGIRIGIFDACQSGAVTAYKGGKRAEPFYLASPQKIKGQVIIASTAANERAQESESLKGSIFSFYWLNGLRGSADASGDRRVTLDEAYHYAYRKTVETSTLTGGEAQHPMYRFNIHGEGDITLTDLSNGGSGIRFDRSCEGKFLVLSDAYTDIFADFSKKRNTESYVSLDPGSYTVINANNGEVGMYSFTVDETNRGKGDSQIAPTILLSQSMLVPNPLTESRIKGANAVAQAAISSPPTSPLSTYSWGIGAGALRALCALSTLPAGGNDEHRALSFSFANVLSVKEHVDLFCNVYYLTGALNTGIDIGFDWIQHSGSSGFSAGTGAGIFYFEKNGVTFSDRLAPAVTAHLGYGAAVGKRTQILVQIPYTMAFGSGTSHRIGVEMRLLFSGRYRDVKVLNY